MTEIEVFRMARQSGIDSVHQYDSDTSPIELLNRFADKIAQHEPEACAKIADQYVGQDLEHNFSALVAHNIRARGQA